MLKAYEFIPFSVSEIPIGSSLVFAPHPDDETFGLGGTILKMTDKKQIVNVVMMTDGAMGGDEQERREELRQATEMLGVNECHFFGAPDQGLDVNQDTIQRVIELLERYQPRNVFFTSPLEYHPDHRATAWVVWNALQSIGFKGNVFSYEIANQSPINTLVDISAVMERKIKAMNVYASQQAQLDFVETITALNYLRTYTLPPKEVAYTEAFYRFENIRSDLMSYYYGNLSKYHGKMRSFSLPMVSVLIRTNDRPDLLRQALDSLARQTYQQFEINIVNDGEESIQDIVDDFVFNRIFIKNNKQSKGRVHSANALLKMAEGDYCIFLDDENTFDAKYIENLVQAVLENKNRLLCYGTVQIETKNEESQYINSSYTPALLRRLNYIPLNSILFSKKMIEKGCRFNEKFQMNAEWDFLLQLAQHSEFYYVSQSEATCYVNRTLRQDQSDKEKSKLYNKWSKIWDTSELDQTVNILENLDSYSVENTSAENQKKSHELELKKKENEKLTLNLQETQQQNNQYINKIQNLNEEREKLYMEKAAKIIQMQDLKSNKTIESTAENDTLLHQLLEERLAKVNAEGEGKRDFKLVSPMGYKKQLIELYEEVFKEPMSQDFWEWKYEGVQWRAICALKDNQIVSHYNGMARDILYFGEPKRAIQPCDIMVSSKARGGIKINSPFFSTTKAWILSNLGANKEFLLTFGFPNMRHMRLGEKMGLYAEVDSIREITWFTKKQEASPAINVVSYDYTVALDEQINAVWEKMAEEFKDNIIGLRDAEYLRRRYMKHPSIKYHPYLVYGEGQKLLGVFVLRLEGVLAALMDIIAPTEHFETIINEGIRVTHSKRKDAMRAWVPESRQALFNHANAEINTTDIVVPTISIVKGLNPEEIKGKWFLMYGDTDFM